MTTIMIMAIALLIFASILSWAFSNAKVTEQNNQYNRSENAAEAAVERVIGQIDRDFITACISNSTAYYQLPALLTQSWPIQYNFSDTNGVTGQVTVAIAPTTSSMVPLGSQFVGLSGLVQTNDVWATATPIGQPYNVPATVHEMVQFATVPLFQYAIFYNVNLEIDPGKVMYISGPVFCNQSIWEGSSDCTFGSTVTAVGTNCQQSVDPFTSGYTGSPPPTFDVAGQPVSKANAVVMPIGTNNSPGAIITLLGLPPPAYAMGTSAAYYSSNGIAYPANAADLVISNSPTGTNWGSLTPRGTNLTVYYQNDSLAQVPYDLYLLTNWTSHQISATNYVTVSTITNIVYAGYTWLTNVLFYDWREGWNSGSGPAKTVQAVQVDIGKLNMWLTNQVVTNSGYSDDQNKVAATTHHIGGVYVYNSVPLTSSQLPAVRVANGAQLPTPGGSTYGFSLATPFPIYVMGNYNCSNNGLSALGLWSSNGVTLATANTLPSALEGDSITILSTNWSDSVSSKMPAAGNTTVNAAMLEGIVASNPAITNNYSGGVENFLRLLEDWSKSPTSSSQQILTYNGSIVVLFYSQYATNSWINTGNYYNPPTRDWAFDLNFKTPSKLPPMTPASRTMVRNTWSPHQ